MGKDSSEVSLEALFIETPVRKVGAKPKIAKSRHDPFQGVSSWKLLRELFSRHYVDLQVAGFWLGLAVIIYIKLGR